MTPQFSSKKIVADALVREAREFQKEGFRLVQISASRLPEEVELTYSFDKETGLQHLRVCLPAAGACVPSITSVYWCAFLYENELHDLFNIQVDGLAVDFHGNLYKTAVKFPFGSTKPPAVKPVAPASTGTSSDAKKAIRAPTNGASGSPTGAQPPAHLN